jgi:AraC-like DNA-binding protein
MDQRDGTTPPGSTKLYAEGRTEEEVAAEVGCAATTVSKYVREAGLGRGRVLRRLDTEEIVRRYQTGQPIRDVAGALGASASGVWRVLVRGGVQRRRRGSR